MLGNIYIDYVFTLNSQAPVAVAGQSEYYKGGGIGY